MTHLRIEQNSNNEVVSSKLITKLYELAYAGLDASSNLKGVLVVPHSKQSQVLYLLTHYPELVINTTGDYYVEFADPNVERRMIELFASGLGGILTSDVNRNYLGDPDFNAYHTAAITTFNELSLFTNIKTIDNYAFLALSNLTSIDLSNIENIGKLAFDGCTSLSSLGNTSHIDKIDNEAFNGCTSLTSLGNTSNVTKIYTSSFGGCTGLTSVAFPALNTLSYNVFLNCTSLEVADIPWLLIASNGLLDANWQRSVFSGCSSLEEVKNFLGVKRIPEYMFSGCENLTTINLSSVTQLYSACFRNCTSLDFITSGLDFSNITYLADYVFEGCQQLTGEIELPNLTNTAMSRAFVSTGITKISNIPSLTSIGGGDNRNIGMFNSCLNLKTIDLQLSTSLTTVGTWLFATNRNAISAIEKIVLPSSVTSIEEYVVPIDGDGRSNPNFHGIILWATTPPTMMANYNTASTSLSLLQYPSTAGVYVPHASLAAYQSAWSGMSSLIHSIKDWQWDIEFVNRTFQNGEFDGAQFSSLKIVNTSGNGLVAANAFLNCANLTNVQLEGVTELKGNTFTSCANLESINLHGATVGLQDFYNCTSLSNLGTTRMLDLCPSGFVPASLFLQCSSLLGPFDFTGITRVGGSAFFKSGLSGELNLPDIQRIDWGNAFNTTNITKATLGSNVTYLGGGIFAGCTNLTEINADFSNLSGNDRYVSNFLDGCTSLTTVNITGMTVIGGSFFNGCTGLTQLTGLSNITDVANMGLAGCSNLVSTDIDWSKITTIGVSSFNGCLKLLIPSLSIPNLTSFGNGFAFANCKKLQSVANLGSTITRLPNNVFLGCTELSSVTLPNSLTAIGQSCFEGCTALTSISLPSSCKTIEYRAFSNSGLTSIDLSNVTKLGALVFKPCYNLGTNLTLELNLTDLTDYPSSALYATKYKKLILHSPQLTNNFDTRYPIFENMPNLEYLDMSDFLVGKSAFNTSVYPDGGFYSVPSLITCILPVNVTLVSESLYWGINHSAFRYLIILNTTPPDVNIDSNRPLDRLFFNSNLHIYVPDSAKATYLADAKWSTMGGYNGSDTITSRLHGLSELPAGIWTTGLASLYLTAALLVTS